MTFRLLTLWSLNRQETGNTEQSPLPSLVVCPPTLTGHWCYEVEKFCSPEHLSTLHYTGGPAERQRSACENTNATTSIAVIVFVCKDCGRCCLDVTWLSHLTTLYGMTLTSSGDCELCSVHVWTYSDSQCLAGVSTGTT